MRLGIMQPYFFPYAGHFSLIAAADEWLVFDTCQYTPRTWMNRNRLLHPAGGPAWMTLPLSNGSIHIPAHQARLQDPARARRTVLGQLSHHRRAPFHAAVAALVDEAFAANTDSLVELNIRALAATCAYLGIPFRARRCSELALDLPESLPPGAWAPHLCAALGATAYVNPAAGAPLFNPADFTRRGIALHFLRARPFTYQPRGTPFESNLSILDALLWNGPDRVRNAVEDYRLLAPADLDA